MYTYNYDGTTLIVISLVVIVSNLFYGEIPKLSWYVLNGFKEYYSKYKNFLVFCIIKNY